MHIPDRKRKTGRTDSLLPLRWFVRRQKKGKINMLLLWQTKEVETFFLKKDRVKQKKKTSVLLSEQGRISDVAAVSSPPPPAPTRLYIGF